MTFINFTCIHSLTHTFNPTCENNIYFCILQYIHSYTHAYLYLFPTEVLKQKSAKNNQSFETQALFTEWTFVHSQNITVLNQSNTFCKTFPDSTYLLHCLSGNLSLQVVITNFQEGQDIGDFSLCITYTIIPHYLINSQNNLWLTMTSSIHNSVFLLYSLSYLHNKKLSFPVLYS